MKNQAKPLPPVEFLRECFEYNPETGELKWAKRPEHHFLNAMDALRWNAQWAGTVAGYRCAPTRNGGRHNYLQVGMTLPGESGRKLMMIHRIIMALMGHDVHPGVMVDHRNGDPWDNRLCNLRIATAAQNSVNAKGHADKSTKLPRGILPGKGGKGFHVRMSIGTFPTLELAMEARHKVGRFIHGEFARVDARD